MDNNIIKLYKSKKDINKIGETFKKSPGQIISILMKHNIITKRSAANGYKEYTNSEEYLDKVSKAQEQEKLNPKKISLLSLQKEIQLLNERLTNIEKKAT